MKKPRADMIRFLVSAAERKAFEAAATATGLTLSAWLRMVALKAAADVKEKRK